MSTPTPRSSAPSTLPAGTSASSNTSSHVPEPRMPSLSSLGEREKPGVSPSTMKAVMPCGPASGRVFA